MDNIFKSQYEVMVALCQILEETKNSSSQLNEMIESDDKPIDI